MNFATYLNQAWNDHANNAQKVSAEFAEGLALVESNEQLAQFVGLVTHVMGEHLGQWREGLSFLQSSREHALFVPGSETEKVLERSLASLKICANPEQAIDSFSLSDQIRILAVAGSALSERDSQRAKFLLLKALGLAETGLEKKDPANRALAVTGNNLASALEEKASRTRQETELMILAAKTGRVYWERVGSWLEVSRAEYRLAMTYLKAEQITQSHEHAQICVELCRENLAGALDLFYAYEALALVERRRGNQIGLEKAVETAKEFFNKLSDEDKKWCETSLKKLA